MKIFRGFDDIPRFDGGIATLGSFDGVHCGHMALLNEVLRRAREKGVQSVVYTFEPHPRITLNRAEGLRLLSTAAEKARLLEAAGVDNLIYMPFTEAFSRLSPDEFISQCLVRYGVGTLVVGYNHRFGRDKQGDYEYLSSAGRPLWPEVVEVGQYLVGEGRVSSTIIRNLVAAGDMERAVQLLGHAYLVAGHADGDGYVMPEEPEYKLLPPAGKYAAEVDGCRCEVLVDDDGRLRIEGCGKRDDILYINIGIRVC